MKVDKYDPSPRKGYRRVLSGKVIAGDLTYVNASRDEWGAVRPDEIGVDIGREGWLICRKLVKKTGKGS